MKLVAIDTSGPVIGVALLCDGDVRVRTERVARGAEARLVPWIHELAAEVGIALAELDGLAVGVGPGAFTGVRVGMATAAGLATALNRPLWGCDSLAPRAARVGPRALALLDARKGRVYAAAYDDGVVQEPADVTADVAVTWLTAPFMATGEGALVYADLVRAAGGQIADGADDPGVDALARLAAVALAEGRGRPPHEIAPTYVRGFS